MMRLDKWTTIVRGDEEIEINVEFDASPIVPATWWQPSEGGEIEILAVFANGVALDPPLSDEEDAEVMAFLESRFDNSDFDDGEDWDARRDRDIDDRLTAANSIGDVS